jgi:FkbM family methyltransferase
MSSLIQRISSLASNPHMMVAFSSYTVQRAIGRAPSVRVHGGHIRGFRRFNDFWWVWMSRLSKTEIALIQNHGGNHLVDVGVNFGVFALAMAHEHSRATIHTFEPAPRIFSVLRENLHRNHVINVRTNQIALSDQTGVLKFTVNEGSEALSHIGEKLTDLNALTTTLEVQSVTLDEYCQKNGIERIDMLKIDVEGAEPKVLRGASKLLSGKRIACIYLEFCPLWLADMKESPETLRLPLEAAGYQLRELAPDGTVGNLIDLAKLSGSMNILAVPT